MSSILQVFTFVSEDEKIFWDTTVNDLKNLSELPDDKQSTFVGNTHANIDCLCFGIFRQLHCYWPLLTSPTNTPGFALIKMPPHTHPQAVYTQHLSLSLCVSTCWTLKVQSDSLKSQAYKPDISSRWVRCFHTGSMRPACLLIRTVDRSWTTNTYQCHYKRGSSAWNWEEDISFSLPDSHGKEASSLTY